MLKEIIKDFKSGKCTRLKLVRKTFLSGKTYYEARLYTSIPKAVLPFDGDYKRIGEDIIDNYPNWMPNKEQGYEHELKLSEYPSIKIKIKKIDNE